MNKIVILIILIFVSCATRLPDERAEGVKVLCPAYFYPSNHGALFWQRLIRVSRDNPGIIYLICNVNSGPGKSADPLYKKYINLFLQSGGKILGYVSTEYGARSLDLVKKDIDNWYKIYGVSSIFIDEQPFDRGYESYYSELYSYIKKRSGLVVSNPGVDNGYTYLEYKNRRVSDTVVHYENSYENIKKLKYSWRLFYNGNNFAALVYSCDNWEVVLNNLVGKNIHYLYVTNDGGDNPWDSLPPYFEEMCYYISSLVSP